MMCCFRHGEPAGGRFMAAFALPGYALAQTTSTPRIDKRQENQERRIDQGVKSGELTKKEAARLEEDHFGGYRAILYLQYLRFGTAESGRGLQEVT